MGSGAMYGYLESVHCTICDRGFSKWSLDDYHRLGSGGLHLLNITGFRGAPQWPDFSLWSGTKNIHY